MKEITKKEAFKLIADGKQVFNINTGVWYYYIYGTSTVPVFPVWVKELPEDGWRGL